MTTESIFLKYSADKLTQLADRIAACIDRLNDEQIWARNSTSENAVGNLVLHLCGNVTQWIGSGVGGRPDTRQRDAEFAARGAMTGPELKLRLSAVVSDAVAMIQGLAPERLVQRTTVQKYDITVLEAIYHVVEHFSGHTGQIIFAAKFMTSSDFGFYKHLRTASHTERVP